MLQKRNIPRGPATLPVEEEEAIAEMEAVDAENPLFFGVFLSFFLYT